MEIRAGRERVATLGLADAEVCAAGADEVGTAEEAPEEAGACG